MRPSNKKSPSNSCFELALFDKRLIVPASKKSVLLMHPSAMKSLKLVKGAFVVLHTEKGQLLFRSWPCVSLKSSTIMVPHWNYFQHYSEESVLCSHYTSYIGTADRIILKCDRAKPFMNTENFKKFMKYELDHIYLKEGLVFNISYLGYSSCFTVERIVSRDVDDIINQESFLDICAEISSLNISEDHLENSIDETSIICSTPISSKQASNRDLHCKNKKYMSGDKPEQFYSLHSQTKVVLQNFKLKQISPSNQMTLEHLCGLEKQVSEMKSYTQALLNPGRGSH